jgi:hypothetical protein
MFGQFQPFMSVKTVPFFKEFGDIIDELSGVKFLHL